MGEISFEMNEVTQNLMQPEDDNVGDINTKDTDAATEGLPTVENWIIGEKSKHYTNN